MASYPSSIASFPTHNSGDIVQPSDVNNPNAEIVAVETGLLNGTQHNVKPLTDDTYSVGDSSHRWLKVWTQDVDADGVTTLASGAVGAPSLSLGGATSGLYSAASNEVDVATAGVQALKVNANQILSSPTQPAARVFNNTTQSVNNSTLIALTFSTADFNQATMWAIGNPTRLTVPTGGAGFYLLIAKASFAASSAGTVRQLRIRKNGSDEGTQIVSLPAAATQYNIDITHLISLAAADYVEVYAFQDSGGALNVGDGVNRANQTEFAAIKIW